MEMERAFLGSQPNDSEPVGTFDATTIYVLNDYMPAAQDRQADRLLEWKASQVEVNSVPYS